MPVSYTLKLNETLAWGHNYLCQGYVFHAFVCVCVFIMTLKLINTPLSIFLYR